MNHALLDAVEAAKERVVQDAMPWLPIFMAMAEEIATLRHEVEDLTKWANMHIKADQVDIRKVQGHDHGPKQGIFCRNCDTPLERKTQKIFCSKHCANTWNQRNRGVKATPKMHRGEFGARIVAGEGMEELNTGGAK